MMRSNNSQISVVILVLVGTCMLAFYFPFVFGGDRLETRPDIVLTPRFTTTPTPIDRAMTREAFALQFFTPTNTPKAPPTRTPVPSVTATSLVLAANSSAGTLAPTTTGTATTVF